MGVKKNMIAMTGVWTGNACWRLVLSPSRYQALGSKMLIIDNDE
jgi:hypothetical protein